jgi:hypothetical protein
MEEWDCQPRRLLNLGPEPFHNRAIEDNVVQSFLRVTAAFTETFLVYMPSLQFRLGGKGIM